jgi:hypothetical protein
MTPREVIRRNLEATGPERIGMAFSGERWNDMRSAGIGPSETWTPRRWTEGNVEYYDDEWGNVWHRLVGMSQQGEIYQPALADWALLETYQLPDLANPQRYQRAAAIFGTEADRYRLGSLPGFPFAICRYLRKMETYFCDLLSERERIDVLHDRVAGLLEQVIQQWAESGADGIFFCEDWGIQNRLLVSPAMWREIYKPLFARLCGAAHRRGLHVLMHSCGYNWDILDDLAEAGINAFQFDQPALYGLERLAGKLRALKVCLYAPVDIQQVLPTGDRQRIEAEAQRMIDLFGGGLIAKNYGDLHGIGVAPEWDSWAYQVFATAAATPAAGPRAPRLSPVPAGG